MVKGENLFEQFPPVSKKEWMDKITADLKGADFNKKMVWKTIEGFDVMPFYRKEDLDNLHFIDTPPGEYPWVRGTKSADNNWFIRQNIIVNDYSEANRKALRILMRGVDSIGFIIADPESVNRKNFDILLNEIHLESIELNFSCNGKAREILDLLIIKSKNQNIRGGFEADPLGKLMINGTLCIPVNAGFDYLASVTEASSVLPEFRMMHINASNFNNAGADIVTELAFGLSMGSEYLHQLTERNISTDLAASKMRFSFGTGSNYFGEIAKLRAARLLWSLITESYKPVDIEKCKMEIHCETSEFNKTVYDPYVNMLRTQTEAMSAVLGGTDSLTIKPFDSAYKKADDFSERIARNQQLILKEESHFGNVADPAGGSYYIENLTNLIADSAWKLFLDIEAEGGFLKALQNGFINKKLSEKAAKRRNDIASGKMVLLGTNQFPDPDEKFAYNNESLKSGISTSDQKAEIEPITIFRASEEYEKIRMIVDKSGSRPVVFLFTIGDPVMRKARAQFSANFFACAGYKIIDNAGFRNVEDGVSEVLKSNADILVICSSDEEYVSFASAIIPAVKDKVIVVIAGNPASSEELKSLGVSDFISLKSNVVEKLKEFNNRLGIIEE